MKRDPDCIFCKIVAGEVPSQKVLETDEVFAFLDIAPVKPGHVLVIPKEHFATLLEMDADLAAPLHKAVRKLAAAAMEATGAQGFNLQVNTHKAAGQLVPHVHYHIIPRHEDDGLTLWSQSPYDNEEAMQSVADKIRATINT
ncbi:HIT family protein [Oceanidesulfovibrio indonesiensis]|uniref:HIT family protein n=1 Tax=Oceanidesulfovibrio indonesiensis TaxID=54767 RepID=A0A7M3ME19_9BACT|nr:HIT family protein [Oceanidesulfovibrio indonesiensis]TVM16592.1 HIT family protein [Oceanidesulfovibrio indonesiensis]